MRKNNVNQQHLMFGGDWTVEKLERVQKYLHAYTTALKNQPFALWYVDAFAGTGHLKKKMQTKVQNQTTLFDDAEALDAPKYIEGSTRIALKTEPRFSKYIFVEKEPGQIPLLENLRIEFPEIEDRITIVNHDCNTFIPQLCTSTDWKNNRAVLFLDPFGMEVNWSTLEAIARTQAIDLWLLFPLGVGVMRMLKNDANITASWAAVLTSMFGTTEWYDVFYKTAEEIGLFDEKTVKIKDCNYTKISQYFVSRLETIFPAVAKNPLPLCNTNNVPLFLLCFAAGNPKGAPIALRIAEDILGR